MPTILRLTQYAHAAVATSPEYVRYRGIAPGSDSALLEYFDREAIASTSAPDAATYVGVEASDSGPSVEPHRVLMIVAFCVPPERYAEVEEWYCLEHGPLLLQVPGWLRMRRYRVRSSVGGPTWTSLALHELRSLSVLDSPERAFARSTAWRARLEREAWFAQAGRFVYERLQD